MNKINVESWKDFLIGAYFEAINTGNILSRDIVDGSGPTPFVTASGVNNGVTAYIDASKYDIIKGNCILIGGKTFTLTYQKEDFVSNDSHNIVLYCKSCSNESIYLSIITALKCSLQNKYHWGDAVTKDKLLTQTIKLPANCNGEPDWEYMEQYMTSVAQQTQVSLNKLTNVIVGGGKKSLDTSKWGTFMVGELFEIYKPKVYHTYEVKESPNGIPYVVRSKFDNGIKYRVSKNSNIVTSPDGVISFGSENATFFYQGEEWCSGRDIYYIDTRGIPKESCLFIIACLQTIVGKYSYSNGLFPDLLRRETIKLPIDGYGKPDWNYMKSSILSIKERISSSPILL